MAIRATAMVAKTLLSEEGEAVLSTAVRLIQTTTLEEAGTTTFGIASKAAAIGDSVAVESRGFLSKTAEIPSKTPKEYDSHISPPEVEAPGTRGPPEVNPSEYTSGKPEINITSPAETNFPNPKNLPELKPGELSEIKTAEKDAEMEKKEEEITNKITNNVPSDPNIGNVVEQGRQQQKQEIGDARTTLEVDDRRKNQQESFDDGSRQVDVGDTRGGPEVGQNPVDQRI